MHSVDQTAVTVVVGTYVGQHFPGQPTVVVDVVVHLGEKMPLDGHNLVEVTVRQGIAVVVIYCVITVAERGQVAV